MVSVGSVGSASFGRFGVSVESTEPSRTEPIPVSVRFVSVVRWFGRTLKSAYFNGRDFIKYTYSFYIMDQICHF